MSSSIDSRSGARHGSYILGERLAAGGMAEVFTAQSLDRHFDTAIVVKRMLPHLARDRSFVSMFIDEARLSTRLDHPNIVKVYEFEATARGLSLVMELIDGPDLLAVLKRVSKLRRRIPPELAVFIVCHVLEALDYAHTARYHGEALEVIHRDVSPSNVLLSRRGGVKLADFGIARAAKRQQETATGTLKGKYAYMSPEQVLGDNIDARSDIFSTAIVLAEMLMGHRLFSAASDLDVLLKVRRADLSRLDKHGAHLDPALDRILRGALARKPSRRYQTAGAFRDALSGWLQTCPSRASAKHLADYLAALERETGNLCKWRARTPQDRGSATTISGTETRLARIKLRKAAVAGREVFALGGSTKPAPQTGQLVQDLTLDEGADRRRPCRAPTSSGEWDLDAGELETVQLVDLLCEIGHARRTGLLRLQSGDRIKELYFANGHPEFVRSNVASDRFGQFLVRRGVLSERQLSRVLAALPHFNGRMGQALVSLGVLAPVDAVRLLSEQIEYKIVDACRWRQGTYSFTEGLRNPWPALTLELDTLHIIGRNLDCLPREHLATWARRHRSDCPVVDIPGIDAFGFDRRTARLMHVFVGKRSIEQILEALPESVDPAGFVAAAYVLARANVLRYGSGDSASTLPERRKFRRVAVDEPATVELYRRKDAEVLDVNLRSITCTGMGLQFAPGRFCRLRRGEHLRVTFRAGRVVLTLQAKVAWCTGGLGDDLDFGLELDLALVPAAAREQYASWVVELLDRGGH